MGGLPPDSNFVGLPDKITVHPVAHSQPDSTTPYYKVGSSIAKLDYDRPQSCQSTSLKHY
jgi:hypothetical protein